MPRFVAVLICAMFLTSLAYAQTADFEVDVVVYGGTSAGVIAAYSAKMYGKSVLLVEPGRHLGGMSSGGLGQTDIGNKYAVTGLARARVYGSRLGRGGGRLDGSGRGHHGAECRRDGPSAGASRESPRRRKHARGAGGRR